MPPQDLTPPQSDNEQWLKRLRGEDGERDAALEELRAVLLRGLTNAIDNRYGDVVHAEDVVQDALVRVVGSLDTFKGKSRFTTWAMTIAVRVGISALRRKHCADISLEASAGPDSLRIEVADDGGDAPERQANKAAILEKLNQLIESSLTERQKWAVRALLDGLPVDEIARRTGSSRNAIYKLVHDARLKLRSGFEREGIMAEDIHGTFN